MLPVRVEGHEGKHKHTHAHTHTFSHTLPVLVEGDDR